MMTQEIERPTDRVITVALKIREKEQADAFWDAYRDGFLILGCQVISLAEGNFNETVERHLDDYFDRLEITIKG